LAEFRSRGPFAPPGNYQAKLSADGKSLTVPLQLKMDPRVNVPASDIAKEFELELKIRETLSNLHDTVREIRETRVQLRGLHSRLQDPRYKSISGAADSLEKKITPIEEQLLQVNAKSSEANLNYPNMLDEQLHYLTFSVEVDDAPTQQQYAVFEDLSRQAAPLIAKWKEIRSADLADLNTQVQQNVPAIYLNPAAN
jgi:seryl-tRNA synthetase